MLKVSFEAEKGTLDSIWMEKVNKYGKNISWHTVAINMWKGAKNCLNRIVPDGKFFKHHAFIIENAAFPGNLLMVLE